MRKIFGCLNSKNVKCLPKKGWKINELQLRDISVYILQKLAKNTYILSNLVFLARKCVRGGFSSLWYLDTVHFDNLYMKIVKTWFSIQNILLVIKTMCVG